MTAAEVVDVSDATLPASRWFEDVEVGQQLPAEQVDLTPTFVISTALATRDFEEVHHDVDAARDKGLDTIFLNILTTMGLCQRVATAWAGPDAKVVQANVRLGIPALAGDVLELVGEVVETATGDDGEGLVTVEVSANVPKGRHGKARIVLDLPRKA